MATNFSIEDADLTSTSTRIQSLWVEGFVGYDNAGAAAKLHLGYLSNPAGVGNILVLKVDGQIQGTLGIHPRAMYCGIRQVRAVALADFMVSRKHRSIQPALMLMKHTAINMASSFDLVYGAPNLRAAPIFLMAGFNCIGNRRRFAKPIASAPHVLNYLPHWAARLCAPAADLALELVDRVRSLKIGPQLSFKNGAWDDTVLDKIWAQRPKGCMFSNRSSHMLHWRFGATGRASWLLSLAYANDSTVQGYVVWRQDKGLVEIGDFFCIDTLKRTGALILAFTRWIKHGRVGATSITLELFGNPVVVEQLKSAGMLMRPQINPLFVGKDAPSNLSDPAQWFFTSFDSDAD